MDLDEYFAQSEHYFSESAGQLQKITEMAFPHVYHAFQKLLREFGDDFAHTPLWQCMWDVLNPTPTQIREQLLKHGKVAHMYVGDNYTPVRSKLVGAANRIAKKVKTHKENGYVVAEMTTPTIRVRAH